MLRLQLCSEPHNLIKLSGSLSIGRDEANDLVLPSPSVSDFHAEINADGDFPTIIDLLSTSGTFVNERRINQRTQLKAWDRIRLGTVELEINDSSSTRPSDWALRSATNQLAGQSYPLGAKTVVGRGAECDLSIDCDLLSRRHAEITVMPDHLHIRDLGSANGTYLNGRRIDEGKALPGDLLRFDQRAFSVIGPEPSVTQVAASGEDDTLLRMSPPQVGQPSIAPEEQETLFMNISELKAQEETQIWRAPAEPPALLVEESGLLPQPRIELHDASYTLGRSMQCDVVLAESSVSKRHARLFRDDQQWIIEDCGSHNGLMVNGRNVQRLPLNDGDGIELGRIKLVFLGPYRGPADADRTADTHFGELAEQQAETAKHGKRRSSAWSFSMGLAATALLLALILTLWQCRGD